MRRADISDTLGKGIALGIVDVITAFILRKLRPCGINFLQHMVYGIKGVLRIFTVIKDRYIVRRAYIAAVSVIRNSKNQAFVKSIGNIVFNDLEALCHDRLG